MKTPYRVEVREKDVKKLSAGEHSEKAEQPMEIINH